MRDCWLLRHRGRSDWSIAIGLTEALGPRLLAFPIARAHAYDAGDEHRCPFRGTPVDLGSKSDRNARCSAKDVSVLLCRGSLRTHCGCRSVNFRLIPLSNTIGKDARAVRRRSKSWNPLRTGMAKSSIAMWNFDTSCSRAINGQLTAVTEYPSSSSRAARSSRPMRSSSTQRMQYFRGN
jgi:hypothetical protein